jgi:hypothetical protein
MRMHECRSSRRKRGRERVCGHCSDFERFDIATTVTELMSVTNDEPLPPAANPEFAYEQFRLTLATAKFRCEIDVACRFAQCGNRQHGGS